MLQLERTAIESAVKTFERFRIACIESYTNKKIVHLAKFAKKKRTRKKNVQKIFKWAWNTPESWYKG